MPRLYSLVIHTVKTLKLQSYNTHSYYIMLTFILDFKNERMADGLKIIPFLLPLFRISTIHHTYFYCWTALAHVKIIFKAIVDTITATQFYIVLYKKEVEKGESKKFVIIRDFRIVARLMKDWRSKIILKEETFHFSSVIYNIFNGLMINMKRYMPIFIAQH